MPEEKPQMESGQLALPALQNTSAPKPRLCQKSTSPLKPGKTPPESDGALSMPSTKLAPGASVVLTPNAMSIFWACAKFENAVRAAQANVKRTAIRNVCFNRNLRYWF